MNRLTFHRAARGTLIAAFAALSSVAAQASGAYFSSSGQVSQDPDPMIGGTIPLGPPGIPQLEQNSPGAQGPVRADPGLASDPSIRDTNPLTMNGPWEQLAGNRIVSPALLLRHRAQQ